MIAWLLHGIHKSTNFKYTIFAFSIVSIVHSVQSHYLFIHCRCVSDVVHRCHRRCRHDRKRRKKTEFIHTNNRVLCVECVQLKLIYSLTNLLFRIVFLFPIQSDVECACGMQTVFKHIINNRLHNALPPDAHRHISFCIRHKKPVSLCLLVNGNATAIAAVVMTMIPLSLSTF